MDSFTIYFNLPNWTTYTISRIKGISPQYIVFELVLNLKRRAGFLFVDAYFQVLKRCVIFFQKGYTEINGFIAFHLYAFISLPFLIWQLHHQIRSKSFTSIPYQIKDHLITCPRASALLLSNIYANFLPDKTLLPFTIMMFNWFSWRHPN